MAWWLYNITQRFCKKKIIQQQLHVSLDICLRKDRLIIDLYEINNRL